MGFKAVLTKEQAPLQIEISDTSPWNGIIFNFNTIDIKETIFGNCRLRFTYDILEGVEKVQDLSYTKRRALERHMGDILLELVVGFAETRDSDLTESDQQRGLCAQGAAPSKA